VNNLRPHGTVAIVLATYGILIPLAVIVTNARMKKFAGNFLTGF
jgi:hypothetical protein